MVTSAVPPNETVSVFTGNLALPNGLDQFTVAITVPPWPESTTASVVETDISEITNCKSLRNFVKCYRSAITIEDVVLLVQAAPISLSSFALIQVEYPQGDKDRQGPYSVRRQRCRSSGICADGPVLLEGRRW